jgi:hypothetical protein
LEFLNVFGDAFPFARVRDGKPVEGDDVLTPPAFKSRAVFPRPGIHRSTVSPLIFRFHLDLKAGGFRMPRCLAAQRLAFDHDAASAFVFAAWHDL